MYQNHKKSSAREIVIINISYFLNFFFVEVFLDLKQCRASKVRINDEISF